jgi:hypothetical protein
MPAAARRGSEAFVASIDQHRQFVLRLREAARGGNGAATSTALRSGILARVGSGEKIADPFDALVHQIDEASYRVSDEQVSAVRAAAGSDKAAFEIVMTAGIGAGLVRWDAAIAAIEEAGHATA